MLEYTGPTLYSDLPAKENIVIIEYEDEQDELVDISEGTPHKQQPESCTSNKNSVSSE